MKRKNSSPERAYKGFSFTVPKHFVPVIDRAAAKEGRSRSSYLAWLVLRDREKNKKIGLEHESIPSY